MSVTSHVSRVRVLYKSILRLHRGLPPELKALGDEYVKDEFRRHKAADTQFVHVFMQEWTGYAITLAKQLGKKGATKSLGLKMTEEQLSSFSDDQIEQMYNLFIETQKPVNPDNPIGENPNAKPSMDS